MISRHSNVGSAYVNSIGISSVFHIGDSMQVTPKVKALAIQREEERYFGSEGNFSTYPIFKEEIPLPVFYDPIVTNFFHENPKINVHTINITAISSSAVFHIGSTKDIVAESRTKHIRQLKD